MPSDIAKLPNLLLDFDSVEDLPTRIALAEIQRYLADMLNVMAALEEDQVQALACVDGTIGPLAVDTAELDALAVTTAKIAADAVDDTKIADNSIGNEHMQDDAIDSAELAAGAIDREHQSELTATQSMNGMTTIIAVGAAGRFVIGLTENRPCTVTAVAIRLEGSALTSFFVQAAHQKAGGWNNMGLADTNIAGALGAYQGLTIDGDITVPARSAIGIEVVSINGTIDRMYCTVEYDYD